MLGRDVTYFYNAASTLYLLLRFEHTSQAIGVRTNNLQNLFHDRVSGSN